MHFEESFGERAPVPRSRIEWRKKPKATPIKVSRIQYNDRINQAWHEVEAAQRPVFDLYARVQLAIQLASAVQAGGQKGHLPIKELVSVAGHLYDFSNSLYLCSAITLEERRAMEIQMFQSGRPLLNQLDIWISDCPFGLRETGLLDGVIPVVVLIKRIIAIWVSNSKMQLLPEDDAPGAV